MEIQGRPSIEIVYIGDQKECLQNYNLIYLLESKL